MGDKIELDLEDLGPDRDRRRAESPGGDIERRLPAMVEPGGQRQPDLADDLGPELQGRERLAPGRIGEIGPDWVSAVHGVHPVPFAGGATSRIAAERSKPGPARSRRDFDLATTSIYLRHSKSRLSLLNHHADCCSTQIEESRDVTQNDLCRRPGWGAFMPGAAGDCPEFSAGSWGRLADLERDQTPADPGRGGRGILAEPSGRDR